MRIAYVTDQWFPQTATDTQQIINVVSSLAAEGVIVELFVPRRHLSPAVSTDDLAAFYGVPKAFETHCVRSVYPSIRGIEKVAQGLVGARLSSNHRFDAVYTRNLPIVVSCLVTGTKPVVYETYRPWPDQKPWTAGIFRRIGDHPRFLGAVLHSRLAADSYERVGVAPEKLLVAHNAYDPSRMKPVLEKNEAREHIGLPTDLPIVVYTGDIYAKKGIGTVLEIASYLPDVRFVLVGARGRGAMERRCQREPNVTVVPRKAPRDLLPYWYAADVLLIPPTGAPLRKTGHTVLPIKTFEYLAAGRPIFGPDTPDLREVLHNDHNALLVPPDAPKHGANQLRSLLADTDRCERLAQASLESAAQRTWEHRARKISQFLEKRLSQSTMVR
jgi:glycosyltransferase involved in cell wall biosynthesis